MLREFLSYPGHQGIIVWLVDLHLEVLHDLLIGLDLPLPEGVFQELTRLPLLLALLLQHVFQEVRVPLHEPLGIFEPVLELFLTVTLDPLE